MKIYKCIKQPMPIPGAQGKIPLKNVTSSEQRKHARLSLSLAQKHVLQHSHYLHNILDFQQKSVGKSLRWTAYLYLVSSNFWERTFFQMYPNCCRNRLISKLLAFSQN